VDSRRKYLNHFPTRITWRIHSRIIQAGVCIKLFLSQSRNKQWSRKRKEQRKPRRDLCNVGDAESHKYWGIFPIENMIVKECIMYRGILQSTRYPGAYQESTWQWKIDKQTTKILWWNWKVSLLDNQYLF
jgi:hypothetical protein